MRDALKAKLLVLAAFGLLGVVMLGTGITGAVVSESCCVPDAHGGGCPAEQRCSVSEAASTDATTMVLGLLLIVGASLIIAGELMLEKQRRPYRLMERLR